jgi:hypothetical protein
MAWYGDGDAMEMEMEMETTWRWMDVEMDDKELDGHVLCFPNPACKQYEVSQTRRAEHKQNSTLLLPNHCHCYYSVVFVACATILNASSVLPPVKHTRIAIMQPSHHPTRVAHALGIYCY